MNKGSFEMSLPGCLTVLLVGAMLCTPVQADSGLDSIIGLEAGHTITLRPQRPLKVRCMLPLLPQCALRRQYASEKGLISYELLKWREPAKPSPELLYTSPELPDAATQLSDLIALGVCSKNSVRPCYLGKTQQARNAREWYEIFTFQKLGTRNSKVVLYTNLNLKFIQDMREKLTKTGVCR